MNNPFRDKLRVASARKPKEAPADADDGKGKLAAPKLRPVGSAPAASSRKLPLGKPRVGDAALTVSSRAWLGDGLAPGAQLAPRAAKSFRLVQESEESVRAAAKAVLASRRFIATLRATAGHTAAMSDVEAALMVQRVFRLRRERARLERRERHFELAARFDKKVHVPPGPVADVEPNFDEPGGRPLGAHWVRIAPFEVASDVALTDLGARTAARQGCYFNTDTGVTSLSPVYE